MSEPMFPSTAGSDAAAPAAPEQVESGSNRKVLFAVGGAVAAVALGAGAFFLLSGGGGGQDPAASAPVPQPAASAPAPAPSASTGTTTTTIKTVTVAAHDPFAVLFPVAAPSAAASSSTTGTTQVQTAVGQTPAPTTKVTLTVSSVNPTKQTATVSVDGTKYTVGIGKTFGSTFLMYSVFNSSCVGILFGDQSVPVCTTAPATVSP